MHLVYREVGRINEDRGKVGHVGIRRKSHDNGRNYTMR